VVVQFQPCISQRESHIFLAIVRLKKSREPSGRRYESARGSCVDYKLVKDLRSELIVATPFLWLVNPIQSRFKRDALLYKGGSAGSRIC